MKRMIFISILLVFSICISGCISQTAIPVPMTGPPPLSPGELSVNSGGSALAIAFTSDEISTASPEAKERFIKGLTSMTQYGRYNESLRYFDDALALDQNFTEAWLAKGVAFHNMKRYDDAIRCYDNALAINPLDAGIWHMKGVTLNDMGKRVESAECNRRAAELDPRYGNR
ncbi:MAG: tetratricopeptide repeat protein [Methanoregula sp.]